MKNMIMESELIPLKVKVPDNEYKLLQMIPDKKNRSLTKKLEDNISFILENKKKINTAIKKVNDSTINPRIPCKQYFLLEEIADKHFKSGKKQNKVEKLIACALPLIILDNKDLLLKVAENDPNSDKSEFIKNELDNLEKDFLLFSE